MKIICHPADLIIVRNVTHVTAAGWCARIPLGVKRLEIGYPHRLLVFTNTRYADKWRRRRHPEFKTAMKVCRCQARTRLARRVSRRLGPTGSAGRGAAEKRLTEACHRSDPS